MSIGILYFSVLTRLAQDWWSDPNASHGFFVPVFSGYVLWKNRTRWASLPAKPTWHGLLIVALALSILIVGVLGADLFLSRSSLVILIAGLAIYFRGWRCFRAILFPWACLFLMIPIPTLLIGQLTYPLQILATRLAHAVLVACGIPVLREGNVLSLPALSLEVAQACSSIRSLLTMVTLAVIYGYFREPRVWRRIALVVAAVPIAIAANGLRIAVTGLMAQRWGAEMAEGFIHTFEGLFMVSLAFIMFLLVHGLLCLRAPGLRGKPA
ncbi:MAG TPA: exosortase/archaeosortase family protein [Terriglobia bacterium]|nr:exosortase/archaeosortase family protein [Terriglobia bacterium]